MSFLVKYILIEFTNLKELLLLKKKILPDQMHLNYEVGIDVRNVLNCNVGH